MYVIIKGEVGCAKTVRYGGNSVAMQASCKQNEYN